MERNLLWSGRRSLKRLLLATVALVGLLMSGGPVQACHDQGLTEWLADVNDWFMAVNWDNGTPNINKITRIDNWGTANIETGCAAAKILQLGYKNLTGGTVLLYPGATLKVRSGEYVGKKGDGTVIQLGGLHKVECGALTLGYAETSSGTYALEDGELIVRKGQTIGRKGIGSFSQSAGLNRILEGGMKLAREAGSVGSYSMTGGELEVTGTVTVGNKGIGSFYHGGGSHGISGGGLNIAQATGSQGAYTLMSGELGVHKSMTVGRNGLAAFDMFDGTVTIGGGLTMGYGADGSGTVSIFGGTLEVGGSERLGHDGVATFSQLGGRHVVKQTLYVGGKSPSLAMVSLYGGELTATRLKIGDRGGMGMFDIGDASVHIEVTERVVLGKDAFLTAVDGATIHVTGKAFINKSVDESSLEGLEAMIVVFEGGTRCWSRYEVAGTDLGDDASGFVSNFALGSLVVGGEEPAKVKLRDGIDNGNRSSAEALYVHDVAVGPGSTLHLNGLNLYYDGTLDNQGQIVGGAVTPVP